jgi:hypothetical protein
MTQQNCLQTGEDNGDKRRGQQVLIGGSGGGAETLSMQRAVD